MVKIFGGGRVVKMKIHVLSTTFKNDVRDLHTRTVDADGSAQNSSGVFVQDEGRRLTSRRCPMEV